ncbi:peptidase inhibitor family I36 protein [Streptomyces sp. NPDC005799]|uniref:peptidase inhibitor family I36 protein n=1 Tax=Streptomyces sp. NPDC005799 TaxID=3154678 RepID=UPI00340B72EE
MNKRHTAFKAALATGLAIAGTLIVLPAEAQAAWQCQDGYVCLYENSGLTGSAAVLPRINPKMSGYTGGIEDLRGSKFTNGKDVNDAVSSIANNTDQNMFLYADGNYNGYTQNKHPWGPIVVHPHQWMNLDGDYNDSLTSVSVGQYLACSHSNVSTFTCHWVSDRD